MHEMSIAQQLVRIALAAIPEDILDPRVEYVSLRIGKLAAVVPHSLNFCFEILTQDTPMAGARLEIESVPVRLRCRTCEQEWEADEPLFRCPDCEGARVDLISGREIDIVSVTLSDNDVS